MQWVGTDVDGWGPIQPIMSGYPDRTFRPNNYLTRAQITRALYRLAMTPEYWAAGHASIANLVCSFRSLGYKLLTTDEGMESVKSNKLQSECYCYTAGLVKQPRGAL